MRKTLVLVAALAVVLATNAQAGPLKGYADEGRAERACRSAVVWANPDSRDHIYHIKGSRWYGATKIGAYVCQNAADLHGWRPAAKK